MLRNFKFRQKILTLLAFSFFVLFLKIPIQAENEEYLISNETKYLVTENGKTTISQQIIFKNLTENYLVPDYQISLGSMQIENIEAHTEKGKNVNYSFAETDDTTIDFDFQNTVVAPQQEISWFINYETPDVTEKKGNVYEIHIPQTLNLEKYESYHLNLEVAKSLGAKNYISPKPQTESENDTTYLFSFNQDDLKVNSVAAAFGPQQIFNFTLKYELKNDTNETVYTEIPFPEDKENQQVFLEYIEPMPLNTRFDEDSNILGYYEITSHAKLNVLVNGYAKVWLLNYDLTESGTLSDIPNDLKRYTVADKYWDVNDPEIQRISKELTSGKEKVGEKAQSIFDYVSKTLIYNDNRLEENPYRLGAREALNQKDQAVCMEYADLYIALARAASIPARELDGYAYNAEKSMGYTDVLHAWVEIYVPPFGWIPIDPTWSSTASTLDYFSKLDTNHLVFVTKGVSSESPYPPGAYKNKEDEEGNILVSFAEDYTKYENANLSFSFSELQSIGNEFEGGKSVPGLIPQKIQLILKNNNPFSLYEGNLAFLTNILHLNENYENNFNIPPYGEKKIVLNIRNPKLVSFETDSITVNLIAKDSQGSEINYSGTKDLKLIPIFGNSLPLLIGVLGGTIIIVSLIKISEKSSHHKNKKR